MLQVVLFACGHQRQVNVRWAETSGKKYVEKLQAGKCSQCWTDEKVTTFFTEKETVLVAFGYPIRDLLRERGYRFRGKLWRKKGGVESELAWATRQGFSVQWPDGQREPELTKRPDWMIVVPQK